MYVITLSHNSLNAERTSLVELASDEDAKEVGKRFLEYEAARRQDSCSLVVLVGQGDGGEQTGWLGAWHWSGAPEWRT